MNHAIKLYPTSGCLRDLSHRYCVGHKYISCLTSLEKTRQVHGFFPIKISSAIPSPLFLNPHQFFLCKRLGWRLPSQSGLVLALLRLDKTHFWCDTCWVSCYCAVLLIERSRFEPWPGHWVRPRTKKGRYFILIKHTASLYPGA